MSSKSFPLSRVVTRDEVPEEGIEVSIDAAGDELAALARYLDIPAVESMSARLTVTRWRVRGLAVRGTVEARVVQTCVVTLEPVENVVREEVEDFFAPDVAPRLAEAASDSGPVPDIDVEPLVNDRVDVGALACEHLALGLDPYPRKPGVVFETGPGEAGNGAESGAFAALAALRARRERD